MENQEKSIKQWDKAMMKHAIKGLAFAVGVNATLYFGSTYMINNSTNDRQQNMHSSIVSQVEEGFNKYSLPLASAINDVQGEEINIDKVGKTFIENYSQSHELQEIVDNKNQQLEDEKNVYTGIIKAFTAASASLMGGVTIKDYIWYKRVRKSILNNLDGSENGSETDIEMQL